MRCVKARNMQPSIKVTLSTVQIRHRRRMENEKLMRIFNNHKVFEIVVSNFHDAFIYGKNAHIPKSVHKKPSDVN